MRAIGRRTLLKSAGMGAMGVPLLLSSSAGAGSVAARVLALPVIPSLRLTVTDFEAKGDGVTKNTQALQQALDRCAVLGGGEVVIPSGTFVTGTIYLRSHTRLRFEAGAVIKGSTDIGDYPIHQARWEGNWVPGHDSLIHAVDAEDIAISGPGMVMGAVEVGGRPTPDHPFRHPALIEFINCRNVLLEDFATQNDKMWNIHPTYCDNLTIRRLTIRSSTTFSDGIDLDSCRHVKIADCDIAVGDDCIAIKSGRGMEGFLIDRPTEDVEISGCTFADSRHACVSIGSEVSAGARRVRVFNCKFIQAKSHAIFLKSRIGRGSFIEDFEARDLVVENCEQGFMQIDLLNIGYQDPAPVPGELGIPRAANIRVSRVHVHNVPRLLDAVNIHPSKPLVGLTLHDITGDATQGIFLANIRDADIARIQLDGLTGPLLNVYNVSGKGLSGAHPIPATIIPPLVPAPAQPYRQQ